MKEVDMYSTVDDAVKMVVANKVDKVCVQRQHFHAVHAQRHAGCCLDPSLSWLSTSFAKEGTAWHSAPVHLPMQVCTAGTVGSSSSSFGLVQEEEREVSIEEGQAFARKHGCLFVETSAKANTAVGQAFEELVLKVLETPSLLNSTNSARLNVGGQNKGATASCC